MRIPRRLARALSVLLAAEMVLAPAVHARGPLSPTKIKVTRGAPRVNELEGTIDYPVTYKNGSSKPLPGPIQVIAPEGLKNFTTFDPYVPGEQQKHYVTLPTTLGKPNKSFTQIFRFDTPSKLVSPDFTPLVETIAPVDPATAPAPTLANGPPGLYVVFSDFPLRIRAVAGQEFVWDVDATNQNAGTLSFALAQIPEPKPDLVGAAFIDGATIEPITGVLRWTPPAVGLYTAQLTVSDGKANATTIYDMAFQVEANPQVPIACHDFLVPLDQPGGEVPIFYQTFHFSGTGALPNVDLAAGRTASCDVEYGALLGQGAHPIHCRTTDALLPAGSCTFNAVVSPTYPIVVNLQDYVNLRVTSPDCSTNENLVEPCGGVGAGSVVIRNTGLGVAHAVTVTIPYPPEADRNNQLIRTGVDTTCTRNGLDPTSPLVCQLGDLAAGGAINVNVAFAPIDYQPFFSPVTVTVTTSDAELTTIDNSVLLQPKTFLGTGADDFVFVACGGYCQELARRAALEECRRNQPSCTLCSLLGDRCEGTPAWFTYLSLGVFAVGAIVTGIGAVAIAEFGAIDTVVFTASEAGGFIR